VRVIGVVDIAGGRAVHASGGFRERYAPVRAVAGMPIEPGDALALVRAYIDRLGIGELYVADLDAIAGLPPQEALVGALTAAGAPVWVDAGISSVDAARRAAARGAARVIVGLETLSSFDALASICASVGGNRVAFSLDLRAGQPVTAAALERLRAEPAEMLAVRAVAAGAAALIVIDLMRVGTGSGPDFEMLARLRKTVPDVVLLAGGGVRGADDLARLADAGCDGALVATALHDGSLRAGQA
jgi:phosphoribosylformimino-5-aminoimidazole carboxamide ribotide isomerase